MKFGVNYTPRRGWFHSWLDFDAGQVREDFQAIEELGADHVRIFPLWPLLQPNRTLIRPAAIADVVRTVELAAECGLDASVDVLQGHLSSFDFLPAWVQTWHRRNLFTDEDVARAATEPPATTRAFLRGLAVRHQPRLVKASWTSLVVETTDGNSARLPLASASDAGSEQMVAAVKSGVAEKMVKVAKAQAVNEGA